MNKLFTSPWVRVAFRYGTVSAVLVMIFMLSLFYMDRHPFLINPFLDPRVPVLALMLFFGLKELRDYFQAGALHFLQGMVTGFLLTLVCASLCWGSIRLLADLEPRFVSEFVSQATLQTKALTPEDIAQIGQERFDQTLVELSRADGAFMASRYFFQTFILSFFITLIVTVVLRRSPDNVVQATPGDKSE